MTNKLRLLLLSVIDIFILLVTNFFVTLLALYDHAIDIQPLKMLIAAITLVVSYLLVFGVFQINKTIWRYSGTGEMIRISLSTALVQTIFGVLSHISGVLQVHLIYHILALFVSVAGILMSRVFYSILVKWKHGCYGKNGKRNLLIVGAGICGSMMLNEIEANWFGG